MTDAEVATYCKMDEALAGEADERDSTYTGAISSGRKNGAACIKVR